jgi:hypothetical protein
MRLSVWALVRTSDPLPGGRIAPEFEVKVTGTITKSGFGHKKKNQNQQKPRWESGIAETKISTQWLFRILSNCPRMDKKTS